MTSGFRNKFSSQETGKRRENKQLGDTLTKDSENRMESKPKFRYQTNLSVEETGLGQGTAIEGKLVSASLKNIQP